VAAVRPAEQLDLAGDYSHPTRRRRVLLPVVLFLATCLSTFLSGVCVSGTWAEGRDPFFYMTDFRQAHHAIVSHWQSGLTYMIAVMGILLMHEMGHFVQALRHRIPATLPFFIPVPMPPFGTFGAVIAMQGSKADRRQLFDLGVAGPLAGLAIALPLIWIGICQLDAQPPPDRFLRFQNPLLIRLMIEHFRPEFPSGGAICLNQFNPFLLAGWVGMLVTGLNMLPISQLDGGHVAYTLLRRKAHVLARSVIVAAILFVVLAGEYNWVVMLVLVILIGADHPPTANDHLALGRTRQAIGWAALTLPLLCLPPGISPVP
jgi:membrane-associated protease RseP (regulator of RpoE activity)